MDFLAFNQSSLGFMVRAALEGDGVDRTLVDDGIFKGQPDYLNVRQDVLKGVLRATIDDDRQFFRVLMAMAMFVVFFVMAMVGALMRIHKIGFLTDKRE